LRNDSYANTLLTHAQQLYSFAVNATGGRKTYQTSVPQAALSYGSSGYGDDLAIAALFLSWATGSTSLYREAEAHYSKYDLSDWTGVFNWDSKTPGLLVLFSQVNHASPNIGGNFSTWQKAAETYLDAVISGKGSGYLTQGAAI
jgi:endoglucanase